MDHRTVNVVLVEDILRSYDLNVAGYIAKDDAGAGFLKAIEMFDAYWRVVELPPARPSDREDRASELL